ncbi:hypothetical protein CN514_12330 [Bacillus sp. AFS001701]|uniref:DUF6615 family protein n=1 Tax=Bacillus sp. AFS001701 TaxID=2033480 RepID=UPI000BF8DCB5|nr:DUF6615 family protein [Bacillus sp. AFS001701]PET65151.1 hypothetical protein CN514_12330 [Bacillus sp. AFS001701]
MSVCKAIKDFSQLTWFILEGRFETNLSVGEETITDISLIELQKSLSTSTRIEKFTKKKEDEKGADWEWWIIEHGKAISLRVQAKILSLDMKYKSLNYIGKSKKVQIDTLINSATTDKCIPMYIFYNYVNTFPTFKCKCGESIYDEYEGVTYSFATTIKGLVGGGTRKSYDYHEVRPISDFLVCLFCCNDKSKSLINVISEKYEKMTGLKIEDGIIKEKVPKYVKKISPNIVIEEEDLDIKFIPEYVIVTQIN